MSKGLISAQRAIERNSFCVLATASKTSRAHAVGILYVPIDGNLYFAIGSGSRKAKNIAVNPYVAVCIPVRQYPVGPPFCVQFQGTAAILARDDPTIVPLIEAGRLKSILGFGGLNEPDLCFVKVTPGRTLSTYGVGVPLLELIRDPLHASRTFARDKG